MSYPWANNLLYRLTGSEIPIQGNGQLRDGGQRTGVAAGQGERRRNAERINPSLAGLNALWQRAENQVPGWRSITLRPPPSGRGPMTFTIDTGAGGRPDQRFQLTLDRRTAEVVRWDSFSSYNTGRRLRSWLVFFTRARPEEWLAKLLPELPPRARRCWFGPGYGLRAGASWVGEAVPRLCRYLSIRIVSARSREAK